MPRHSESSIEEKLDNIADLLKHLLALELVRAGVPRAAIGKHLKMATAGVGNLLKGVKTEP